MKKALLLVWCMILALSFFSVSSVFAKSLTNPLVDIKVTIYPNGSARVVENRTLQFNGDFTFGFYEIPKGAYGEITDIKVIEGDREYALQYSGSGSPDTYVVTDFTDYVRVDFFFTASNESRTFTYSYLIKDVVSVHEDYGEFYWKLQSDGWGFQVDNFRANILWQEAIPTNNYHIWAHETLWGTFTKTDERSAYLEVAPVPASDFVEVRVLLPSSYFTVSPKPGLIYESIRAEEEVWAREANADRDRAKWLRAIIIAIQYLFYILALWLIWNFFRLYKKYGKEPQIANESIYYREPPSDLKPAIVGMLYNFQKYDEKYLQATMIDLIRRKHLAYEEIPGNILTKDHQLTLLHDGKDELEDYEELLLDKIIFEGKDQVTLKGLKKKFQRDKSQRYYNLFNSFKKKITDQTQKMNFFDKKSNSISNAALAIGLVLVFFGGFAGAMLYAFIRVDAAWSFMVLVPVGLLYLFGFGTLRRRTETGKQEYSKWKAFRLFMKDFSNLQAYGPKSLIIWERFLVYATVFGIASIVLKALKLAAPNLSDMDKGSLMTPAMFTAGAMPAFSSLNSAMSGISSMAGSISRTASSSYSSGSGGGGGFSGGGGGGGGGSRGGFG